MKLRVTQKDVAVIGVVGVTGWLLWSLFKSSPGATTPNVDPTVPGFDGDPARKGATIAERYHNPGNITDPKLSDYVTGKLVFAYYQTDYEGAVAMVQLLNRYVMQGYDTVLKILNRWAPPSSNNTGAYINRVSNTTGIQPEARIVENNRMDFIPRIAYAMHIVEAGKAWLSEKTFIEAAQCSI